MIGTRRWAYYELINAATPQTSTLNPQHSTLNPRQKFIMEYLENHDSITTIDFLKNFPEKITERTVRKDLKKLENFGLIEQIGQTKGAFYIKKVPNNSE